MEILFYAALTGINGLMFSKLMELQSQISELSGSVEMLKRFLSRIDEN